MWANALDNYSLTPNQFPDQVVFYNSKICCIKDQFPKAKHHYLILPRYIMRGGLESLDKTHLPLLDEFKDQADLIIKSIENKINFKIGFHSVPSMSQLHMHLISTDFESESLKNKKHWNSFNTAFFIEFQDVIDELEKNGRVVVDTNEREKLLKNQISCCGQEFRNIPALKVHIKRSHK